MRLHRAFSSEQEQDNLEGTKSSTLQMLLAESMRREQFLIERLLQQCDGIQVGNILPSENSDDGAMGNSGDTTKLSHSEFLPLHLSGQADGEKPQILGGDVAGEVSPQPINTLSGDLGRLDGFSPRHGSTVNHVDPRPPVPHHLVGAPADREKIAGQDACQTHPVRHYTGLYIDQSSDGSGMETMATTKPAQGILLSDAIETVLRHWSETEALEKSSLIKFTDLLHRYENFTRNLGVTLLGEQSESIAAQWIQAKGKDRSGNIVYPATSTMNTRRSALRKFFRDAETLKLSDSGLVVKTYVAPRQTGLARPLTKEEASSIWMYAKDAGAHTRRPVMFALLLSGVHSSEVGLITVKDVDVANRRVWAHGDTSRIQARWVIIPDPYFRAVVERIDFIRGWLPEHRTFETFQLTQGATKKPMGYSQNRAASACKEVFRMVGLSKDPSVTPSSVSLYAGAQMLNTGERIETIARVLGYASLDSCAKALGYYWEIGEVS